MGDGMTTPIGFVIQPGEAIPEDVVEVKDNTRDAWKLNEPRGWYCPRVWDGVAPATDAGYLREGPRLAAAWGPLTVTAVREQPALVGGRPLTGERARALGRLEPCRIAAEHAAHNWYDGGYAVRCEGVRAPEPAAESVSVDLLDLVRRHGDARRLQGYDAATEAPTAAGYGEQAQELFARIEAEVNRLRTDVAEVETLRRRERSLMEARDDWMRRERAARDESERLNIAVSQEIEARDENAEWADRLANEIAAFLHIDIGEHSNMNLPWQAALIALTDAVSPPSTSAAPDPLVLSLPSVPDGATALIGVRSGVRYARTDVGTWRDTVADQVFPLAAVLSREAEVRVVMREPRTWSAFDITEPEDRPTIVDVEGHGRWRLGDAEDGVIGHPDYYWSDDDGERDGHLMYKLRQLGEVTEVFDEDGTRAGAS